MLCNFKKSLKFKRQNNFNGPDSPGIDLRSGDTRSFFRVGAMQHLHPTNIRKKCVPHGFFFRFMGQKVRAIPKRHAYFVPEHCQKCCRFHF